MKTLKMIGLACLVGGLAALGYNYFMIQPNLGDIMQMELPIEFENYSYYRHQSDLLGLISTSLCGIAGILGLIGFFKAKDKGALLYGAIGLVGGVLSFIVAFAHVN